MTELERCIAFLREIDRRAAGRKVPFLFGTAYLREELPSVWSRNYLSLERDLEPRDRRAGPRRGGALARRRGRRPPQARGLRRGSRRTARSGARRARVAGRVRRGHGRGERAGPRRRPLLGRGGLAGRARTGLGRSEPCRGAHRRRGVSSGSSQRASACSASAIDVRFFGARADGEIGAYCELYSLEGTAQIENVLTLARSETAASPVRSSCGRWPRPVPPATTSRSCSQTGTTGPRSSTASSGSTRSASSTTS